MQKRRVLSVLIWTFVATTCILLFPIALLNLMGTALLVAFDLVHK